MTQEQEAADCTHSVFYMLPEAYGTPLGMELMEYGAYCAKIDKDLEELNCDPCPTCPLFERKEDE